MGYHKLLPFGSGPYSSAYCTKSGCEALPKIDTYPRSVEPVVGDTIWMFACATGGTCAVGNPANGVGDGPKSKVGKGVGDATCGIGELMGVIVGKSGRGVGVGSSSSSPPQALTTNTNIINRSNALKPLGIWISIH